MQNRVNHKGLISDYDFTIISSCMPYVKSYRQVIIDRTVEQIRDLGGKIIR